MPSVSRRDLFSLASAAGIGVVLPSAFSAAPAEAQASPASALGDAAVLLQSLQRAFTFQNQMMDAYATGATVRLTQSYSDQALGATAFTYDNAVTIHAYLARGTADDLERAAVLGAGLLYAQAHNFPVADGRFGQAYYVNVRCHGWERRLHYAGGRAVLLLHQCRGRPGVGRHGAGAAFLSHRRQQLSCRGGAGGQLDREERLQHTGAGRLLLWRDDQPAEHVCAFDEWQIDRAQHRLLCLFHHAGAADEGWRGGERDAVVGAGAACARSL